VAVLFTLGDSKEASFLPRPELALAWIRVLAAAGIAIELHHFTGSGHTASIPMKKELSEIERLDIVARAEAIEPFLSNAALVLIYLALIGSFFGVISNASKMDTLAIWAIPAMALPTLFMLRHRWCYALYGISLVCFYMAAGVLFNHGDESFLVVFMSDNITFLLWAGAGYAWWKAATPFIAAQADDLEQERNRVGRWLAALKYGDHNFQVLEFSVKSFWNGYWTYRLLNAGNCWAIAKFKLPDLKGLSEFRVLAPNAINLAEQTNGKLRIEIASRPIRDIEVPPEMKLRLLQIITNRPSFVV